MFAGASAFNQDIGTWNVAVTNAESMFDGVTLSMANYDALLNGWAPQDLQLGVMFSGGDSRYCAGAAAHANMTSNDGWDITDAGVGCYTVSYDANGATGGSAPDSQTKYYDANLTLATSGSLFKTGYTFSGWNTQANGSGDPYAEGGTYTANAAVTLCAMWTADLHTVTYAHNPAGGAGTLPTQPNVPTDGTFTVGSGSGLTRPGYSFVGWNDGANTYAAGATYTMGVNNVTLTAQWTADLHIVTYATTRQAAQAHSPPSQMSPPTARSRLVRVPGSPALATAL